MAEAFAVDPRKVVQAADALEVGILKNIQARLDAGKPVGEGELKALRKIREKFQQPVEAPDAAGFGDRPGLNKICLRYCSLAECAKEIGCTERWLNNWKRGVKKCTPAIPFKLESRKVKVQPAVVYEHILRHAAKGSPALRPPAGYVAAAVQASAPADLFEGVDLAGDPHALIKQILTNKELLQGLSEAKIRAVVAAAAEMGREKERHSRMEGSLRADKVLAMLRSLVFVFVNLIHERATARASALLRQINAEFAIDIAKSNPAAAGLLADFLRGQAQEDIAALHEELKQQCEGVRLPELEDGHAA